MIVSFFFFFFFVFGNRKINTEIRWWRWWLILLVSSSSMLRWHQNNKTNYTSNASNERTMINRSIYLSIYVQLVKWLAQTICFHFLHIISHHLVYRLLLLLFCCSIFFSMVEHFNVLNYLSSIFSSWTHSNGKKNWTRNSTNRMEF